MLSKVDSLLQVFKGALQEPWTGTLSGAERVWFLVYDPADHRRLELRLGEFELATQQAGKRWLALSPRECFPTWMAAHDYRDAYFEDPEALADELETSFLDYARSTLQAALAAGTPDGDTLVVLRDASSLFGLARLSEVVAALAPLSAGRLLVLFPGEYAHNQYRLLNARDGWDYLARPLTG